MEPVPHRCLLQYNSAGVSVKSRRMKILKLKTFTAPFVMLAIGYLLGFVAFLWERWTGRQGGRYKAATTKSDRGLKRQKVQETGGFKSLEVETIEPTTPKVEQNVSKVLQVDRTINSPTPKSNKKLKRQKVMETRGLESPEVATNEPGSLPKMTTNGQNLNRMDLDCHGQRDIEIQAKSPRK